MKKILSILVLIVFTLTLSGCGSNEEERVGINGEVYMCTFNKLSTQYECEDLIFQVYDKEQVDELLEGYVEKSKLDSASDICLILYGEEYDCLDELENDLEAINDLQAQIDELKSGNTTTEYVTCDVSDFGAFVNDIIEAYEQGYTLQKDQLGDEILEFKDGVWTGDFWTIEELIGVYCSVD